MSTQFEGIINLYGKEAFKVFQKSHVLVVGLGGVGSWCAESLVRSGIGSISLLDMDEICVSNINRQVHALHSTVGRSKTDALEERLKDINPDINISSIFDFFSSSTQDLIEENHFDFIIDAIDSVTPKALLLAKAKELGIPIIATGATGARIDPTLITINDLNKSINDKLLKQVKRKLRRDYQFSKFTKKPFHIPTVFSKEIPLDQDLSTHKLKSGKKINCQSGLGSASFVTSSFAMTAVSYVLNQLAQVKDVY